MRATLLLLILLSGCQLVPNSIKGGESRHETKVEQKGEEKKSSAGWLRFDLFSDGHITLSDTRANASTTKPHIIKSESISTTQPSAQSWNDLPKSTSADEGEIGGLSFDQVKRPTPTSWGLIILLLIAAGGFWIAHRPVGIIACGAMIVLGFLRPDYLVWGAILAFLWVLFVNRQAISQLIKGNSKAIEALPPEQQKMVKTEMAAKQDESVQRVVADVKAKL